jgi:DNA-binding transcriptional LysR family regulator
MHYTLSQLQIFVKVVDLLSVTKASENLHMTQPAVSIQLKNLQDQFEIPLIEVIGKKVYVTDFGKEIYITAKNILAEINNINHRVRSYKGDLSGKLIISIVSTGKYVMPYFLSDFLTQHPKVDLLMDVTNKSKVIESLKKNEIDFALVSVMPKDLLINKIELIENQLFVVGNKNEKKQKSPMNKNELNKMSIILREEGSGTRFIMETFFKKNKIAIETKIELTSNEAVKQAVIAGLGKSILPLIGIRNEIKTGDLKIIPTNGFPLKSKWQIIWLKGKKLSPIAEAYINHLTSSKEEILKKHFAWINQKL